jgi:AraC-like DNA-binding protein
MGHLNTEEKMDSKPWYQRKKFDSSFPFLYELKTFRNYPFHWHEFLEVAYVHEGKIFISVDGQTFEARKGDIVIINVGLIHGFFDADPGTSISIFQFWLDLFDQTLPDLRDRVYQKLVFGRKIFISPSADGDIHRRMETILFDIRAEYFGKKDGARLAIKARLYDFALVFLREFPVLPQFPKEAAKRNYYHQKLERIFSFIYENYTAASITLDRAANAAALSKFYFARFFREQTGQTFHAYLSKVRVRRAEEFLSDSDMPITDIAYQCGFTSLKTFNRLFKAYTGTSPSNYRSGKLSPVT